MTDRPRRRWPRGRDALLAMQDPAGWWKGELETNVTMDAEDLLLRQFLGILHPEQATGTAAWIRSQQRDDGTWATFHGGPADLSTTVEAYVALRLAGDPTDAAAHGEGARLRPRAGGIERTRVFTRIWLALFGVWPWDDLPALPPEVMLLPPWFPLNIYDFACWARQTIVPLTVVARPTGRCARCRSTLDELLTGAPPAAASLGPHLGGPLRAARPGPAGATSAARCGGCGARALRRAERWIVARQEADGSWGGIQPPWVYSLIALHLLGYPLDHPVMKAGFDGLDRFTVDEDGTRRLEACQSPVWDTALRGHRARRRRRRRRPTRRWCAPPTGCSARRSASRGDWAVRRPDLAPGGWAFEFDNDNYPDIDDTAEVVLALRRVAPPRPGAVRAAIERGVAWTLGMQCRDGGWGAFDVDNTRELCRRLPFCDFGEVIDPPQRRRHRPRRRDARRSSAAPGPGRSTAASRGCWRAAGARRLVVRPVGREPRLRHRRRRARARRRRRATRTTGHPRGRVAWLEAPPEHRRRLGRGPALLRRRRWRGRGASTASQTAWALLALLAAGRARPTPSSGASRGWSARSGPTARGTSREFTGTGFPGDFSINYHLYRQVFPVMALGRYRAEPAVTSRPSSAPLRIEGRAGAPPGARRRRRAAPGWRPGAGRRGRRWRPAGGRPRPSPSPASAAGSTPRCGPATSWWPIEVAAADGSVAPIELPGARRRWPTSCAAPGSRRRRPARVSPRLAARRRRRRSLAAGGALAVDMESAWLLDRWCGRGRSAPPRRRAGRRRHRRPPPACRPATVTGGVARLRVLRRVAPALERVGGGRRPARRVLAAAPAVVLRRGRAGHRHRRAGPRAVRRARSTCAARSSTTPTSSPSSKRLGAVFVEELDEVPAGATVVLRRPRRRARRARRGRPARGSSVDRRHLPARRQGPPRGPPLRDERLPHRADRPRRPRGDRRARVGEAAERDQRRRATPTRSTPWSVADPRAGRLPHPDDARRSTRRRP